MTLSLTEPANGSAVESADVRNIANEVSQMQQLNLLGDPTFLCWHAGDALAPAYYALSGASAAIARTGAGLGDTRQRNGVDWTAKVTAGGAAAGVLTQNVLKASVDNIPIDWLKAKYFSLGVWVWASAASAARVGIDDGTAVTYSGFHTGNSTWQRLLVTAQMHATVPAKLAVRMEASAPSLVGYFSEPTLVLGGVQPTDFLPCPVVIDEFRDRRLGAATVGAAKALYVPQRPGIVRHVQLRATSVAGSALIVDVNAWDGAAWQTMFSTRPQVAAASAHGGAAPDGTYQRRCYTGAFGAVGGAGQFLDYDIDQVGSTTPGDDVDVFIRKMEWARPLECFNRYDSHGA